MQFSYRFSSIHVIESLGEADDEPGKKLVEKLGIAIVATTNVPLRFHEVFDVTEFRQLLDRIFSQELPAGIPLLHIECHGGPGGLQFRDRSEISWKELSERLWRFNRATQFNSFVVFSCCDGIHQLSAVGAFRPCPAAGLIGCQGSVTTPELIEGFDRFYATLLTNGNGDQACHALQSAIVSSPAKFAFVDAGKLFCLYTNLAMQGGRDPAEMPNRVARIRALLFQKLSAEELAKLRDEQIVAVFGSRQNVTLRQSYDAFFATAEVPNNLKRFPFDDILRLLHQQSGAEEPQGPAHP